MDSTGKHTSLNARVVASEHEEPNKDLGGVGLVFVEGVSRGGDGVPRVAVLTLIDDGPAQRDGTIAPGDLISAVDEVSVIGRPLAEVRRMILGRVGTTVRLTFDRMVHGQHRTFSVSLTRYHSEQLSDRLNREREERTRAETEYKRQIAHLRNQIDQLQGELNRERSNSSRLEQEISMRARREVTGVRGELEEIIQRLKADLQAAREDAGRFKGGVAELEARLRAAETEIRGEVDRRAQVEAELASLKRQLENDRSQLGMRGEYEKVLTVMRSKLQANSDDLHAEALRRERAEEDLARLHENFRQLQENMANRENQHRNLIAEHIATQERLLREGQDRMDQLRSTQAGLQRERDNSIRLQAELKSRDDELRATQDSLGEHRRAMASMEAQLTSTRDENAALAAGHQDDSIRLRQLNHEFSRLTAENGRLTATVKDLSMRLDSTDLTLQQREAELAALRRDFGALSMEFNATRVQNAKLTDDMRALEGLRNEDRRTMAHEFEKLENRVRSEGEDNRALSFANSVLSNEVNQLRAFADAAHSKERAETMNVERHLLRLHSAADQMNSTLSEVMEAKRSLLTNRVPLPLLYNSIVAPAALGQETLAASRVATSIIPSASGLAALPAPPLAPISLLPPNVYTISGLPLPSGI